MKPSLITFTSRKICLVICVAALCAVAALGTARAANDTWTGSGGDGNWGTSANWTNAPTTSSTNDVLIFDGTTRLTNTNTLAASSTFSGITFNSTAGAFTLNGNSITSLGGIVDNSLNLETINLGLVFSSTHSVNAITGGTMALNGIISGAGGVTKTGGGTVSFSGINPNTYSGATTVSVGTLKLDFITGAPGPNIINTASALSMGGGTLQLAGAGSVATSSQTFASTAFTAGASTISVAGVSKAALTAITPSTGGVVQFVGPATSTGLTTSGTGQTGANGNGSATGLLAATGTITTTSGVANRILQGSGGTIALAAYATVGLYDFAAVTGTSPFTVTGMSQVSGTNSDGGYIFQTANMATDTSTTAAYDIAASLSTNTNTTSIGALRFNVNAANTLTVRTVFSAGGVLVTPNVGAFNTTIATSGTIAVFAPGGRSGSNAGSTVIWQNNTAGLLNMNVTLADDGNKAGSAWVQAGPGTVIYTGGTNNNSNPYTGQTYLDGGASVIFADSALGAVATAATVNLNGGTIVSGSTLTLDNAGSNFRPIALNNNGGGLAAVAGTTLTVDGVISGSTGPLTIGIPASSANGNTAGLLPGTGAGTANTTGTNVTGIVSLTGTNTFSGGAVIASGTLRINGVNALGGANYGGLTFNGGALQYASSLTSSGDLSISGSGVPAGSAAVTFSSGTATIDTNGNNVTYSQTIGNSGTGGLIKTGSGTLTLSVANNYSGGTNINGGNLAVNNTTGSATGSGSVNVNSTGILSGTGIISGLVTVNSGGKVAPGNSVGTISVGSITFASGSLLDFEFGTGNDQINVTGSNGLTINGGSFNLYQVGTTNPLTTTGTYNLFQYVGGIGGTGVSALGVSNSSVGIGYTFGTATISGTNFVTIQLASSQPLFSWAVDSNGNWSTAGNWTAVSGTAPPNIQLAAVTFGSGTNGVTAPRTVSLDQNAIVGSLSFSNTNSYTIADSGFTLNFDNGVSASSISVTSGTHTISTAVNTGTTGLSIAVGNSTDGITMSGTLSGSTGLAKSGAGFLVLNGSNSYNGGTTLSGGILQIGNDAALSSGTLTFAGNSTLKAGTNVSPSNNMVIGGGVTATVDSQGNTITLNGIVSDAAGNGALTKTGSGTLVLAANNTYAGATTVNAGTLQVGNGASGLINAASAVTVNANGTLAMNQADGSTFGNTMTDNGAVKTLTSGTNTLSAVISGTGTLTQAGSGAAILGAANTFTGDTVAALGTLILSNTLALQNSTLNYNNQGGSLSFGGLTAATLGGLKGAQSLALTNTGSAAVALTVGGNGQSTGYSGGLSGSGSLIKTGTGTLTLTGSNNIAGSTTVNGGGTLTVGTGGSLSTSALVMPQSGGSKTTVNGGTFTASNTSTINSVNNGFQLVSGTATFATINEATESSVNNTTLIRVDSGVFNASSINVGRSNLGSNGMAEPASGSTTIGVYVAGGSFNVSGGLNLGGAGTNANSEVSMRIDGGAVTVGGALNVSLNNTVRWSVRDINGGSLTVSDTTSGIVLGGSVSGQNELLVRSGTATTEMISLGTAAVGGNTTGIGDVNQTGGVLYIGAGGIVQTSTNAGFTATIKLTGGTLGAKADWSSAVGITLGANPTIQAADVSGSAHNITLFGNIGGTAFTKTGGGTLTLSSTSGNFYTGVTTVNAGTLNINSEYALGGSVYGGLTLNGGTLQYASSLLNGFTDITADSTASPKTVTLGASGGTVDTNGNNVTYANALSGTGSFTKTGNGTLTLNGTDTYNGVTIVNGGTLAVGNASALGTTTNGTVVANGAALKLNNVNYATAEGLTISGSGISNGGALTNTGTSTYAGAINVAGNAIISAGGSGQALNLTGGITKNGTTLTIGGGGTVNVSSLGISGTSANSDLIVDNSTLNLSASSSYNGPTTVQNNGTLQLNLPDSAVQPMKTLNIATTGTAILTQHTIPGVGTDPEGSAFVKLLDTSALNIAGAGVLDMTNNAMIVRGGTDAVINALLVSGFNSFSNNGPGINSSTAAGGAPGTVGELDNSILNLSTWEGISGLDTDPNGAYNQILVKYTWYGDANLDGTVTPDDYLLIDAGASGGGTGWLFGDFNYDGTVSPDDYLLIDAGASGQDGSQFTGGTGGKGDGLTGGAAAVPEPGSIGLLLVGTLGLLALHRRRQTASL